jgi:hypothetical protein
VLTRHLCTRAIALATRHENAPHCRYGVATIRVNKEGEEANKSIYFFFLGELPLYEEEGRPRRRYYACCEFGCRSKNEPEKTVTNLYEEVTFRT